MQPLVSVIVPVYNAEERIEKCVKSIQLQTYKNLEIICINDGSTDKSAEILERLAEQDNRMKIIHNENQGVSATRNCGIDNAIGEFIQFVDSDDELYPDATECMVVAMVQNKSDVVFCGYHRSDEVDICVPMVGTYDIKDVVKNFCVIYKGGVFNQPWNKMYKRELMNARFHESMNIAEDAVFNVEYLKNVKKVTFLDKIVYYYVVGNPDSLSVKFDKKSLESEIIKIKKVNALMTEYGFENNVLKLNQYYEEDFRRCIYQLIYGSGKPAKTLNKEVVNWIYNEVWNNILTKNRNIECLNRFKVKLMVNGYVYLLLAVKKIRTLIK